MTLQEAKEFVRNTKYIVFSENENRRLQEKLFEFGCCWGGYEQEVKHLECKFIFVNDKHKLSYGTKRCCEAFDKSDKEIRNVDDVISVEIEEPKPKFDPKTLQPFDKVLTKNDGGVWNLDLYDRYDEESKMYVGIGAFCQYCVPYNDETKHLHQTREEAPEFYRLD